MSIGKGQVPLMLALELLLSLRSNFNYISDCIHCVCLCGSKPLLGLRAWIQLFPSLHHTFCIFETGVWYWLIKPLCLCQLSQDWQWKMKGIDGVQRHDCAWSDSWNCLFFFLFPMSHIQSKIGLKKKKKVWMSARFDKALETHQKQKGLGVRVSHMASRKSGSRLLSEVRR